MNISIYVLAGGSRKYHVKAMKEYEKRLGRYCKISVKRGSSKEKLIKDVGKADLIVVLDETGKQLSSEKLAAKISEYEVKGISKAAVLIGMEAPYDIMEDRVEHVAISRMEMSRDLLTVAALEQIYRAYKILNNETYHK